MRIALITETFLPQINGVTTTLLRILEHLEREGHKALLLAPRGAPATYAGTRIVPLGGAPLPFYPELNVTPPQSGIAAHLRAFRPDLIHLVSPAILGMAIPSLTLKLGIPLISSYHTNLADYSSYYGMGALKGLFATYLRWMHNRSRVTLCPSHATLTELRAHGYRRLKVWGRGVDTNSFHPSYRSDEWRASVGAQPGDVLLVYVGRLAREKRLDLLVEPLRMLRGVRLVIVGDGPARAELEAHMAGLPVHFTGYRRGVELATAYASSDVFVFPSFTDTFGQVIQEAMASGLAVAAAHSGGAIDLVQPGVTGWTFKPGTSSSILVTLRRLLQQPAQRIAMGQAGRRAAEQRSWPTVMGELMGHYQDLLCHAPHRIAAVAPHPHRQAA